MPEQLRFLKRTEVLALQGILLKKYGGSPGLRDAGLLDSALAMPESGFGDEYFHKDIYEMAAAYLFHLVSNHPFVDGNKRIGLAAAVTFMHMNGIGLRATNQQAIELVLKVARGEADKPEIAEFFRNYSSAL